MNAINLYAHQIANAEKLEASLRTYLVAVDSSDTGTGKTITACEVARRLDGPVVVVSPKAVVPTWQHWLREFDIEPLGVFGYEKLRTGSTPVLRKNGRDFVWTVPESTLVIWDEAHRGKGIQSQNSRMMMRSKPNRNLLLSATLAQSPIDMRAAGYLLGMHEYANFMNWCLRNGCWRPPWGGLAFKERGREQVLNMLHREIFTEKGVRTRHSDIPDFPETIISAEAYDIGPDIAKVYKELGEELRKLSEQEDNAVSTQAAEMRARQKAELCKVPMLVSMAEDEIEEGNSVVIFCNFTQTREELCSRLKCSGVFGGQKAEDRARAVEDFQADRARALVVNIQAGGVGLSLHDLHGNHPRVALHCATWNAIDLKQALGRVHRAGGKSRSVQRVVFAAGTIEEKICEKVQKKLSNIDTLNDSDLGLLESSLNEIESCVSESRLPKPAQTSCAPTHTANPKSPMIPSSTASPSSSPTVTDTPPALAGTESSGSGDAVSKESNTAEFSLPERKHAKHSPSTLKNKAVCPGWRGEQSTEPNKWAERGTLGHKAAEMEDPSLCGSDEDLRRAVEACLGYRKGLLKPASAVYKEIKLVMVGQFGFADEIIITGSHADLIDYKFASNKYEADGPQFWAYAIGIWDRWPEVNTVKAHVPHPFIGIISVEQWNRAEHYDLLAAKLAAIIARADAEDPATFKPFGACQYCSRAATCPALARLGAEIADRYDNGGFDLPPGSLHGSEITDPQAFANLMRIKPIVEKAASGWPRAALELYDAGTEIPGYVLEEKSGKRAITSSITAWAIARDTFGVTPDEWADACEVPIGKLEDLVAAKAPRGKGAAAKRELSTLLSNYDILTKGSGSRYLKQQKIH